MGVSGLNYFVQTSVPEDLWTNSDQRSFLETRFRALSQELREIKEQSRSASNVMLTVPADRWELERAIEESLQEYLEPLRGDGSTALLPDNVVLLYAGTLADAKKLKGFAVADGSNGAPDYMSRFVKLGLTAGACGGSSTHTHTVTDPSHGHSLSDGAAGPAETDNANVTIQDHPAACTTATSLQCTCQGTSCIGGCTTCNCANIDNHPQRCTCCDGDGNIETQTTGVTVSGTTGDYCFACDRASGYCYAAYSHSHGISDGGHTHDRLCHQHVSPAMAHVATGHLHLLCATDSGHSHAIPDHCHEYGPLTHTVTEHKHGLTGVVVDNSETGISIDSASSQPAFIQFIPLIKLGA